MRDYIKNACEEIDSALHTGDGLIKKTQIEEFKKYLDSWNRVITDRIEGLDICIHCDSKNTAH